MNGTQYTMRLSWSAKHGWECSIWAFDGWIHTQGKTSRAAIEGAINACG
jgi:hypothetical protein